MRAARGDGGVRDFAFFLWPVPSKSQPRTGHTREPDPTHLKLKHELCPPVPDRPVAEIQHTRAQPQRGLVLMWFAA